MILNVVPNLLHRLMMVLLLWHHGMQEYKKKFTRSNPTTFLFIVTLIDRIYSEHNLLVLLRKLRPSLLLSVVLELFFAKSTKWTEALDPHLRSRFPSIALTGCQYQSRLLQLCMNTEEQLRIFCIYNRGTRRMGCRNNCFCTRKKRFPFQFHAENIFFNFFHILTLFSKSYKLRILI
jgi:hypothetical protein